MKPKRILNKWMNAFHQGDANMISELYCANIASRQITHQEVMEKENIRKLIYDAVHQWFVS